MTRGARLALSRGAADAGRAAWGRGRLRGRFQMVDLDLVYRGGMALTIEVELATVNVQIPVTVTITEIVGRVRLRVGPVGARWKGPAHGGRGRWKWSVDVGRAGGRVAGCWKGRARAGGRAD